MNSPAGAQRSVFCAVSRLQYSDSRVWTAGAPPDLLDGVLDRLVGEGAGHSSWITSNL